MVDKIEEKEINIRHNNVELTTKYMVHLYQLRRDIQDAAEEFAEEIVEKSDDLQQYVQHELRKAAECIENISDILAVHTKGHSLILCGDGQQSKDISASREEVSELCYSSDGVEDSHYHINGTEETVPGSSTTRSSKQYDAEGTKQHLVQVALEPPQRQHSSTATKHQSSELSQKTTGGQRINTVSSNDLSVIGHSFVRHATADRRHPKQQTKSNQMPPTSFPPISQENAQIRRPFPLSNNGFNAKDDAWPRKCTKERRYPIPYLEQNKQQSNGPTSIPQEKSHVRRPIPPSNNGFNDKGDSGFRKNTEERQHSMKFLRRNKIQASCLPSPPQSETTERHWHPSHYHLTGKSEVLPCYSNSQTRAIRRQQDHDMRELFGL